MIGRLPAKLLLLLFGIAVAGGGGAARIASAEAETPSPAAAPAPASASPGAATPAVPAKYPEPQPALFPFGDKPMPLADADRQQLASDLAALAAAEARTKPSDLNLPAMLVGTALVLDSQNRGAVLTNARLRSGFDFAASPPAPAPDAEETARRLLAAAKGCAAATDNPKADLLAAFLVDLASRLQITNDDLLYESEMLRAQMRQKALWRMLIPEMGRTGGSSVAGITRPSLPLPSGLTPHHVPRSPSAPSPSDAVPSTSTPGKQTKVNGLTVVSFDAKEIGGSLLEIIATDLLTSPDSASKAAFAQANQVDIAKDMDISMNEAFRLVNQRYPTSTKGHEITISFDQKYSSKGGGSAGTAFALAMAALFDDFKLDPKFALTGDITVDGSVRRVGGIPQKIRGAQRAGCEMVGIPASNHDDVAAMLLLDSPGALGRVQVFSMETFDDAIALARQDRPEDLRKAMELFGDTVRKAGGSAAQLRSPETLAAFAEVLKLAPNHVSAEYLLLDGQGKAPRRLTLPASIDTTFDAIAPLFALFAKPERSEKRSRSSYDSYGSYNPEPEPIALVSFTNSQYDGMSRELARMEKLVDPKAADLFYAVRNFLDRVQFFDSQYQGVPQFYNAGRYVQANRHEPSRGTQLNDIEKAWNRVVEEYRKFEYDRGYLDSMLAR